jgi:hypothetical protein
MRCLRIASNKKLCTLTSVRNNMPLTAKSLRPFWTAKMHDVSENPSFGFPIWLSRKDFSVVQPIISATDFILDVSNTRFLPSVFAFDCNKMASSSFESYIGVAPERHSGKATAWPSIRTYYTAFYSAHALLRLFGRACIHLENKDVQHIYKIAQLYYPQSLCPQTGYYFLFFPTDCSNLTFSKNTQGNGSHFFLWTKFNLFLEDLITNLSTHGSPVEIQPVVLQLMRLRDSLGLFGNNAGTWLSSLRNQVTYRHEHNAWYPFRDAHKNRSHNFAKKFKICSNFLEVNLNALDCDNLINFASVCSAILSLCNEVINDMAELCTEGHSFLNYGPLAVIRKYYN